MDKFKINAVDAVFLLIDFQTNLAVAMKKDVYSNCENNVDLIIKSCETMKVPVIVTEQYSKGLGNTVDPIKSSLKEQYRPIDKLSFSCWGDQTFRDSFKKLNKKYVLVSGIEAHVCVLQSVIDLLQQGHYVHVVSDGVCSRYKADWKKALKLMRDAGAVITTTEIAVFQLLQRAGIPEFKVISPLFKNKVVK
ncbi:MAG: isochorismatase family protein [Dehalococcoidia bacterium]